MNRRTLLALITRVIGIVAAPVVAVPGVNYLLIPLRRKSGGAITQRVILLRDLPVGEPLLRPVIAVRKDAWTVYPRERVGQVWLVRTSDASVPPAQAQVQAYTSVCPHLGCAVQHDAAQKQFVCPCHNAFFQMDGKPVADQELGYTNPTPRGMDALECRIVQQSGSEDWWVEVTYEKFVHGLTEKVAKA